MFCSVIIATNLKRVNQLYSCLNSLNKQSVKDFEVILVVNNADKINIDVSKYTFCSAYKIEEGNTYSARNFGVKKANSEVLLFTDDDCQLEEEYIEKLLKYKQLKQDELILIGGVLNPYPESNNYSLFQVIDLFTGFRQQYWATQFGMLSCASFITNKYTFSEVGGFNDEVASGGDYEFCYHFQKLKNKRFYFDDQLQIFHSLRFTFKEILMKTIRVEKSVIFRKKKGFFDNINIKNLSLDFFRVKKMYLNPSPTYLNYNDLSGVQKITLNVYWYFRILLRMALLMNLKLGLRVDYRYRSCS